MLLLFGTIEIPHRDRRSENPGSPRRGFLFYRPPCAVNSGTTLRCSALFCPLRRVPWAKSIQSRVLADPNEKFGVPPGVSLPVRNRFGYQAADAVDCSGLSATSLPQTSQPGRARRANATDISCRLRA
jgi:hypothetical protein